jgi:hypothetical protein
VERRTGRALNLGVWRCGSEGRLGGQVAGQPASLNRNGLAERLWISRLRHGAFQGGKESLPAGLDTSPYCHKCSGESMVSPWGLTIYCCCLFHYRAHCLCFVINLLDLDFFSSWL